MTSSRSIGLDMNWRNIGAGAGASRGDRASIELCRLQNSTGAQSYCRSHFYDHQNYDLLPGLNTSADGVTEWFDYIKKQKLRTYFNDHPFPVANQTTPEESNFRYNGLSEWIGRGLSQCLPTLPRHTPPAKILLEGTSVTSRMR